MERVRPLLSVEPLENRVYLAGHVAVYLSGEDVVIEGDGRSNCVEFDIYDNFTFRGCEAGGKMTRVNRSRGLVALEASTLADIQFRMQKGNDIVRVGSHSDSVHLSENLEIDMGVGHDDVFILGDVFVDNDLVIKTRQGNDRIQIALTAGGISGSTVVQTDEGDDEVVIQGNTLLDGELEIDTRSGRDIVRLGLMAADVIAVSKVAHIETHDDDDVVCVRSAALYGLFRVEGGGGSNLLAVEDGSFPAGTEVWDFALSETCPVSE